MTVSQKIAELSATRKKKVKPPFFPSMKEEMKKVTWTTKEELLVCTKIVVGAIFALGLGIYGVDLLIQMVLHGIKLLAHFIT